MMKKLALAAAVVLVSATAVGCASAGSDTASEDAALLLEQQALLDASPMPSSTWTMMPSDDDGMESMMAGEDDAPATSSIGTLTADERQFITDMIPHHQQAVDMSTLALTRAKNPKVINLATTILANQAKEISMMTSWVGPADDDGTGEDDMGADDMGHGMHHHGMNPGSGHAMGEDAMAGHGMLTAAQMDQLRAAKGTAFDKLFLTGMIAHHEGAVTMSKPLTTTANSTVADFAKAIIKDQTTEITQMRALLAGL